MSHVYVQRVYITSNRYAYDGDDGEIDANL